MGSSMDKLTGYTVPLRLKCPSAAAVSVVCQML
jgi:hypothetical protein